MPEVNFEAYTISTMYRSYPCLRSVFNTSGYTRLSNVVHDSYSSLIILLLPYVIASNVKALIPVMLCLIIYLFSRVFITTIIHDRHSNPSPSDPLRGGDVLLSQHPFRSPGHPEAHIPILPASGLTSEIPTKYVQCSISGRDPTLIALFVTGILGRIARGHHTSIVGFDIDTKSHYTPATTITAIPTGIKILNRFRSIRPPRIYSITPIYPIAGSPFSSSFGGVTGIIRANSTIDTLLHDTHSVVGHFHHASPPGAVYTFFAAFHNHIPYFTSGYNEFYGRLHSRTFPISPNPIFLPMHQSGANGFPRIKAIHYYYKANDGQSVSLRIGYLLTFGNIPRYNTVNI